MKKILIVMTGFVLVGLIAFLVFKNFNTTEVVQIQAEEDQQELEEESQQKEIVKIISNTDILNQMPQYKKEGEVCKAIEDTIERGDCFQKMSENYSMLTGRKAKDQFYFPVIRGMSEWKNVFYVPIEENDVLGEMQKEDHFDDYVDEQSPNGPNYQRGLDRIHEFWYVFSALVPKEYRQDIKRIYWTDTGSMGAYAFGWVENRPKENYILISHHAEKYGGLLKTVMLHEYAHMLTWNIKQADIIEELAEEHKETVWARETDFCSTYLLRNTCLKEDSYLQQFYQQFWVDIEDEWFAIDWNNETDYKDFFFNHEERFFNSYQGTSPPEDIADSFTFFVITNRAEIEKNQEMKYEKLEFFYQFDEFVELRTAILENLYDLSVKDEEFY